MNPFDHDKRRTVLLDLDHKSNYGQFVANYLHEYINCNVIDIDLDIPIYRIISYSRLKSFISDKHLSLTRPQIWDDPFENFILNAKGKTEDGKIVSFDNIRDNYYAQCWTLKKECDGLWRNFRKNKNVKIKSTAGKIMNYFYDTTNKHHTSSYFVGKVVYYTEEKIIDFFNSKLDLFGLTEQSLTFLKGLLIKREQFSYENEVRFIFNKPSSNYDIDMSLIKNKWDNSDFFYFKIEPNEVIDEIVIDPWVSSDEFDTIKSELISLGYSNLINKSKLYDKLFFTLNIT